jgi:uncharacterized protein DUF4265
MPIDPSSVKLHIDLPNHWAVGGEALWARSLGGDLYEIDNIPFHAYGINYRDVVRATADAPDLKPEVREVTRASGHQTLRIFFQDLPAPERLTFLSALGERFGTDFEGKDDRYFAVDVPLQSNYAAIRDHLDTCMAKAWLDYETCEARSPGSFDDLPDSEASAR